MYTLRPMLSWHYFIQASIFCHMYLKMTHGLSADVLGNSGDRKARRLEQSLYWSCFKSECEFRVELPLQQSEISLGEYPDLFPSPPSPVVPGEAAELRRHAAKLCNEEESWYYYLTEIALRRIGNRIVNTFFRQDRSSWLDIKPLLLMAREFEAQVSSWSAHLPPAMQHYETTSIIRAPHLSFAEGSTGHASRELSWAIDNRLLEMQTWLYQPFLYYLVHAESGSPATGRNTRIGSLLNPFSPEPAAPGLSAEDVSVLHLLIASGIECLLKTIDVRARGHRHHGLWYDLRSIMCAALILLAVVKSGNAAWIPGGVETVWGETASAQFWTGSMPPIGGKIAKVLAQFDFWADEAPDLLRYKKVLETVVREVRGT